MKGEKMISERFRMVLEKDEMKDRIPILKAVDTKQRNSVLLNDGFEGTILDENVNKHGGGIPIPDGYIVFNPYTLTFRESRYMRWTSELIQYAFKEHSDITYKAGTCSFLYVPAGISVSYVTEVGRKVMSEIQRRFDDLVHHYLIWKEKPIKNGNLRWIMAFGRLILGMHRVMGMKNGLVDRAVGNTWQFSGKGVATADSSLRMNEVGLPIRMLTKWASLRKFRDAHNLRIDIGNFEAAKMMHHKRVIVHRNPSHDMSNMMSFLINTEADR
jgi:hypothetical protein